MSDGVVPYEKLAKKQLQQKSKDRYESQTVYLEKRTRETKCCEMVETGSNPYDDTHLCLRKKGA